MTALLSSSLIAIFTAASFFFFFRLLLCSIPAYLYPQEYTFPAAVTCICWDFSLWCRSLNWQRFSYLSQRLACDPEHTSYIKGHIIKWRHFMLRVMRVYVQGSVHPYHRCVGELHVQYVGTINSLSNSIMEPVKRGFTVQSLCINGALLCLVPECPESNREDYGSYNSLYLKQIFSGWKSLCLPKETVRYRSECLYTVQTVLLPFIHVVLDFLWHAAGLSPYASLVLLSFCHCILYIKEKLLLSDGNKNTYGNVQGWSNGWWMML